MIKLKEPYMFYDDKKDVVHIYDGKVEVVRIEHPLINLDYLAQSLGCVIENNVIITSNKEIVKIAPSGICETSEPVAEFDGNHIVWYRFSGEDYKIADVFTDKNGEGYSSRTNLIWSGANVYSGDTKIKGVSEYNNSTPVMFG